MDEGNLGRVFGEQFTFCALYLTISSWISQILYSIVFVYFQIASVMRNANKSSYNRAVTSSLRYIFDPTVLTNFTWRGQKRSGQQRQAFCQLAIIKHLISKCLLYTHTVNYEVCFLALYFCSTSSLKMSFILSIYFFSSLQPSANLLQAP